MIAITNDLEAVVEVEDAVAIIRMSRDPHEKKNSMNSIPTPITASTM